MRDLNSRLLVYLTNIVDDLGGSHWCDGACSFFAGTMYGGGEGAVVSGMGYVDSGRFVLLKVWW